MESPRKFNDCYFYYYSTCTKGDNCVFRHEPSALGCETMCAAWQQGKCLDKRCKLRHMELRKNRKQIPCYWETQPGGCRKKHCPFMHKNPEARTDGIMPSQPVPLAQIQAGMGVPDGLPHEHAAPQPAPQPAPHPVPIMWQQQRQVVLDSAILGVLPGSDVRRVVPLAHDGPAAYAPHVPHVQHAPHAAHAPMPVDPLVVNFEEESDNESAPSTTPTKNDEDNKLARSKSQELLLLEKIQAEAAAFYSYDSMPETKDRKIVRTNLSTKYDRLSLDDLAGKTQLVQTERRKSLDFKVLSLDEIRARKKSNNEPILSIAPITLNLNRKRKSSTTESLTTSGNKIIKVVRSNSIVYKKLDENAAVTAVAPKVVDKPSEEVTRKRTLSEQIESIYDLQDDELVDNVCEFKRIKLVEPTSKPVLIRNTSVNKDNAELDDIFHKDNDSDTEVQIVSVERQEPHEDNLSDSEVIDVETTKICDTIDIVDLSEDDDVIIEDDTDFGKNVPDVVASCRNAKVDSDKDVLRDIDEILDDEL